MGGGKREGLPEGEVSACDLILEVLGSGLRPGRRNKEGKENMFPQPQIRSRGGAAEGEAALPRVLASTLLIVLSVVFQEYPLLTFPATLGKTLFVPVSNMGK